MADKKKSFDADDLNAEARDFYDAINHEHPLPCVLITTAFIEQCLGSLLQTVLKKGNTRDELLRHDGGALGEYFSRGRMAYCLELISSGLFKNIQTIGEIRNRFAHSHLTLDFDDPKITELCERLTMGASVAASTRIDVQTGKVDRDVDLLENREPSERFKISATMTANILIIAAMSAKMNNTKMRPLQMVPAPPLDSAGE